MIFPIVERLSISNFELLWLAPNSKKPVLTNWTRRYETLDELKASYRPGFGLGVRLGHKLTDGYFLVAIDVDVKSGLQSDYDEALMIVDKTFGGLHLVTLSGETGNGLRFFFKTYDRLKSHRIAASSRKLTEGPYAGKNAWEVDFLSYGKQAVIYPTIHPETKKQYTFDRDILACDDLAKEIELIDYSQGGALTHEEGEVLQTTSDLKIIDVKNEDKRFTPEIKNLLMTVKGVDRSVATMKVAHSMFKNGFRREEVLGALTDIKKYPLAVIGYDRRKTKDRTKAAEWVKKYVVDQCLSSELGFVKMTEGGDLIEGETALDTEWMKTLDRKDDVKILNTQRNVIKIISHLVSPTIFQVIENSDEIRYTMDAPWNARYKKGSSFKQNHLDCMKSWIREQFSHAFPKTVIEEAVTHLAEHNGYNPVRVMLDSLPTWDKTPRINTWMQDYFGLKLPGQHEKREAAKNYAAAVFRKWLVAAVGRGYSPGLKFDHMMILEGEQGIGKSRFGAILFGEELFGEMPKDIANKDAQMALRNKMCMEFGELSQFKRNEIELVKSFLTRQVDEFRPPFGKTQVTQPRTCVFIGTTNKRSYLKDETGNRRFCPLHVGVLDQEQLRHDREQLLAEAKEIYFAGTETLYLQNEHAETAKEVQATKQMVTDVDVAVELISNWLGSPQASEVSLDEGFTASQLFGFGRPMNGTQISGYQVQIVTDALIRLGFERFRTRNGVYFKRLLSPDESDLIYG
jgi:predicted P-loop ATPase